MPDLSRKALAVLGAFDDPDTLLRAAEKTRKAGWKRWDCHTPYPVHGLESAMGLHGSLIPFLTIPAGLFGAAFAKTMQWYMSDFDYPLIIGGKPLFSLPAFVPVTFELFVLFAALATFAGIILFCGLGRWRSPLHDAGIMDAASGTRFIVCLETGEGEFSEEAGRKLLEESGCGDIRVVYSDSGND